QEQVRVQLSFVLEAVISQQLIPQKSGTGRVLAVEILVPNPAIRNLIREDKVHQLYSMMQMGQAKFGMQTMNQSLFGLYTKDIISYENALGRSSVPDEMLNMMQKVSKTATRR
ncbi:MAG: type IV pili twitching motility protein PilT, partial [Thermodesulfobacteriota bacterium]